LRAISTQKNTFLNRLKKLQEKLGKHACLVEHPLNLFYLTGIPLSTGKLLLSSKAALLLVDSRYVQIAQAQAPIPVQLEEKSSLASFLSAHRLKKLLFDPATTSYTRFLQLKDCELVAEAEIFKTLRLVKDPHEIAALQKSASLAWRGFEYVKRSLKVGVTEQELVKRFELFCLKNGADKLSFDPIIAFGAHGAMPHYKPGASKLKEGDAVLIDIGVVLNHYHSDMTRVVFFKQKNPYLSSLYSLVKQAHKKALELCKPGTPLKALDHAVRAVFKKEGLEHLFIHALGHGIGLQTHEFPRIKEGGEDENTLLESGMVLTIEPGLYVPGKGGVRYEDTLVITPNGFTNFYKGSL
jgi:Xaa-Pro aminopeptidase